MRELRVLGLADSGATLVCEDPEDGEQFEIPRDEKLRAAARGDASRFGQLEIEGESQLRPREIQDRIRAGAGIEEIAALAGTSIRRVESFAHPVLLERLTMAEKARKGRPSIDGITAGTSVEEMVTGILAARGQDAGMTWDAYREDEQWVLVLRWHVGRSENRARWTYHPGSGGGTLTARDDAAAEIVDPALRVLRPIRENIRPAGGSSTGSVPGVSTRSAAPDLQDPTHPTAPPAGARPVVAGKGKVDRPAPADRDERADRVDPSGRASAGTVGGVTDGGNDSGSVTMPMVTGEITTVVQVTEVVVATGTAGPAPRAVSPGGRNPSRAGRPGAAERHSEPPARTTAESRAAADGSAAPVATTASPPAAESPAPKPATPGSAAGSRGTRRPSRPAMPSWEDVLLGTRSPGRD